jgi:hypothetical protein
VSRDPELRDSWRREWIDSISELADLELQQRRWLDRLNTNPHWSFVEFNECYFSDLGIADGYGEVLAAGYVSKQEVAAIQPFHDAFKRYQPPNDNTYDNQSILGDPAWQRLVTAAGEARQKIIDLGTQSDLRGSE